MKLDFNKPVFNLSGTSVENSNLGKSLAGVLAQSTKGDALKIWEMSTKLFQGEVLDLDQSDQNMLKGFIEKSESLTNLAKAQMLLVFIEAEKK